jgi:hypothetical protein
LQRGCSYCRMCYRKLCTRNAEEKALSGKEGSCLQYFSGGLSFMQWACMQKVLGGGLRQACKKGIKRGLYFIKYMFHFIDSLQWHCILVYK